MSDDGKDLFKDPEKFGQLADKVDRLNKEKVSLEKRIEELEKRMTGGTDKDQMTYNFIVEKQMTQMQWNRERDSSNSRSDDRGIIWTPPRRNERRDGHKDRSPDSAYRGHVMKVQRTSDGYPKAIIGENGEVYIVYSSPKGSPSGSNLTDGREKARRERSYEEDVEKEDSNIPRQRANYVAIPEEDSSRRVVDGKGSDSANLVRSNLQDSKSRRTSLEDQLHDSQDRGYNKQGDALSTSTGRNNQLNQDGMDGHETRTQGTADRSNQLNQEEIDRPETRTQGTPDRSNQSNKDDIDRHETRTQGTTEYEDRKKQESDDRTDNVSSQKAAARENSDEVQEAIIPRVIVVTGFRQQDIRDLDENPVCSEADQENCQCYKIMRESEEWKANVTRLLELLVMNAYGNRCPKSLIKALMNPATREQAIKELLNRTFATDNTLSQDNQSKLKGPHNKETIIAVKNRTDTKESSMPKTFPQYPPYPKAFESKDSLPRHQDRYGQTAASRAGGTSSGPSSGGNKIDIVCPPGSRPVIHIPPSGSPAVTCDLPRSQNTRHDYCCSQNNPCEKHR